MLVNCGEDSQVAASYTSASSCKSSPQLAVVRSIFLNSSSTDPPKRFLNRTQSTFIEHTVTLVNCYHNWQNNLSCRSASSFNSVTARFKRKGALGGGALGSDATLGGGGCGSWRWRRCSSLQAIVSLTIEGCRPRLGTSFKVSILCCSDSYLLALNTRETVQITAKKW